MKKMILLTILNEIRSKPALKKKIKIFAAVGLISFTFLGGLTLWAGYSALTYAAKTTTQFLQTSGTEPQVLATLDQIQRAKLQPLSCWNQAQCLLELRPWLENPLSANLQTLKTACLEFKPAFCEGPHCSQIQQVINTSEGRST